MHSFAIWINVIYCSHYHALEMICVQAVLFQVMVLQRITTTELRSFIILVLLFYGFCFLHVQQCFLVAIILDNFNDALLEDTHCEMLLIHCARLNCSTVWCSLVCSWIREKQDCYKANKQFLSLSYYSLLHKLYL